MRFFGEYAPLFLMFILVVVVSYVLFNFFPESSSLLSLSFNTPWGIFSAMFVHTSDLYLYQNLAALFINTIVILALHFLILCFISQPEKFVKRQSWSYVFFILLVQPITSILDLFFNPQYLVYPASAGLSFVTFGLLGFIFTYFVTILLIYYVRKKKIKFPWFNIGVTSALITSIIMITISLLDPTAFLSFLGWGIKNINVLGHRTAFFSGIILGSFLLAYYYRDIRFVKRKELKAS